MVWKQRNKKAVIVGGSNGIGLAIGLELAQKGYFVEILDICPPDEQIYSMTGRVEYHSCDLRDFDSAQFSGYCDDKNVEVLFITAGLGRVANFSDIHIAEIDKILTINTVSAIKILKLFYERIHSAEPFFCGVMGSIAGWVSSPMFAVYAASKAAVCRFVESVNIELEQDGFQNRILNVSPGSIQGTRFNGGNNDLEMTKPLAHDILENLFSGETLYIPQYEETYKNVITRYQNNAHTYGIESYQYKKQSGRVRKESVVIGYLSGTFDLFHVGHLNLLRRAKQKCDYLIVGVHPSGSWKGKATFIPLEDRKAILSACKYVDQVVIAPEEDSDAWKSLHFDRLFVGSDYQGTERFKRYEEFFRDKKVEIVYFPYTQKINSTQIRNAILSHKGDNSSENV